MRKRTPGWRLRARVSAAGPSFLRCPAASSTSGTETMSVGRARPARSMAGVGQRLGHLDEAEVDRQLAGDLADVLRRAPRTPRGRRRRGCRGRRPSSAGGSSTSACSCGATVCRSVTRTPARRWSPPPRRRQRERRGPRERRAPAPAGQSPASARRSRARASRRARARRARTQRTASAPTQRVAVPRLPQPARVVAALRCARCRIRPQLVEHDLQVAQREAARSRSAGAARAAARAPREDLGRRRRPGEHAGGEHGERGLRRDAAGRPQPVARDADAETSTCGPCATKGSTSTKSTNGTSTTSRRAEQRGRRARGDGHGGQQRGVDRVRPRRRRRGRARRRRRRPAAPRPCTAARARCSARLDGRRPPRRRGRRRSQLLPACRCAAPARSPSTCTGPRRRARRRGELLAGAAELLAVDGCRPGARRRAPRRGRRAGGARPCRPRPCRRGRARRAGGRRRRCTGTSVSGSAPSASTVPERAARSCIAVMPGTVLDHRRPRTSPRTVCAT